MRYKYSEFNILYENNDNTFLFFNTYSGAILNITREEYNTFKNFSFDKIDKDNELFKIYYSNGFIVDEDKDERKILQLMRIKNAIQTRSMFFRILPTTDCNARCFYCYEQGVEHIDMHDSDIDNVVKFIENCLQDDTKNIGIQWYGGEPLLKYDLIKKITIKLKNLFKQREIKYTFSMISNGALLEKLHPKLLKEELELKNIQISLDGYKNEYITRKAYTFLDDDIFDNVIKNIDILASEGIRVDVRLNCDGLNYKSMLELIDYLGKQLNYKNNINVYAYPLYGTYVKNEIKTPNNINRDMFLTIINKLIKNKLYRIPSFRVKLNSCGATNYNSFDILPNGNLLKCMMNTSDIVGNVREGIKYNDKFFKWCTLELPEQCEKCKYLPICEGGCKAGHLGDSKVKCFVFKDIMKEMLNFYINQ